MSRTASNRLAWSDRWSQPSLPQLLDPLKVHHRRVVDALLDQFGELDGLDRSIIWYGPAWKWTVHYSFATRNAKGVKLPITPVPPTLCYLVPRIESPMVCVPLSDEVIDHLPMTRLSRFIRDGIRMAKCAVAIHWACWTPSSQGDVAQIMELVKRRHKMVLAPKAAKN
jgi:hypothetical protein